MTMQHSPTAAKHLSWKHAWRVHHFDIAKMAGQGLLQFDLHWILRLTMMAALVVAFLGGKFTFERILGLHVSNTWLEVRLWFTIVVVIGILIEKIFYKTTFLDIRSAQLNCVLASILVLNLGLALHILWFGNPEMKTYYIIDVGFVTIHALFFAYLIRGISDFLNFIFIVETIGLVLVASALGKFNDPNIYGAGGWAPFSAPLTFYQIEFGMCCCALFAAVSLKHFLIRVLHVTISAIGLFASLSSLSRGALMISAVSLLYMVIGLMILQRPRLAVSVIALFSSVTIAFLLLYYPLVSGRMPNLTIKPTSDTISTPKQIVGVTVPQEDQAKSHRAEISSVAPAGNINELPRTMNDPVRQNDQMSSSLTQNLSESLVIQDAANLAKNNMVLLADSTQRIRMFIGAWDIFLRHKVWGIGFGNYELKMANNSGDGFDIHRYPHNVLLEMLATTGVLGTSVFVIAILIGVIVIHQAIRVDYKWLFLFAFALAEFLVGMVMSDIYDFRWYFFVCILVAAAAWPSNLTSKRNFAGAAAHSE
jgi:hypothetical protein